MERIFVSIKEACGILGPGRSSIYRLMETGQLEFAKFGNRRLIRVASVEALGQACEVAMTPS